jgi:hypothetical protein
MMCRDFGMNWDLAGAFVQEGIGWIHHSQAACLRERGERERMWERLWEREREDRRREREAKDREKERDREERQRERQERQRER